MTKAPPGGIRIARDASTGKLVAFDSKKGPAFPKGDGRYAPVGSAPAKSESVKSSAGRFIDRNRDMLRDLAKK